MPIRTFLRIFSIEIARGRSGKVCTAENSDQIPGYFLHSRCGKIRNGFKYSFQILGKYSQQYRNMEHYLGITSTLYSKVGYVEYDLKHFTHVLGRLGMISILYPNIRYQEYHC